MNHHQKPLLSNGIISLLLFLIIITQATAQQSDGSVSVGMQIPSWIIDYEPTYQDMKSKFIQHYGSDKSNWPFFIQEAERLNKLFKEYSLQKGSNPDYCYYHSFFMDTDQGLTRKSKSPILYRSIKNVGFMRNFYSIFSFYYPQVDYTEKIKPNQKEWHYINYCSRTNVTDDVKTSYANASKNEGILPALLFQFAYYCPTGMLDWCFSEIFPVIDLLFKQDSISETFKILESVSAHTDKLIENKDYIKALTWNYAIHNFIKYYDLSYTDGMPEYLSYYYWSKRKEQIIKSMHKVRNQFNEIFNTHLYNELKGITFNVPCKTTSTFGEKTSSAKLYFENKEGSRLKVILKLSNSIDDKFSQAFNYTFNNDLNYSTTTHSIWHRNSKLVYKSGPISFYKGVWEHNDGRLDPTRKYLYAFKENSVEALMIGIEQSGDVKTGGYSYFMVSEGGQVQIIYPSDYNQIINEKLTNAVYSSAEEILGTKTLIPQIYGMDFKINIPREQAIKIETTPKEIKADGQSTAEISVVLYDYIPNDNTSSSPLPGKTLSFEVQEIEGIKRGSISSSSATTDANGKAVFTYTAPSNELLQKLQPLNRFSSTIKIRCDEYGIEDLAYINFSTDKGKVLVEPAMGIISDCGIVPPDKRYPALITGYFEDENLKPIPNTEVTFSISGDTPLGMLRSSDGKEGRQLTVMSDSEGMAQINYFYAANTPLEKPITETIEAKTKNMTIPLKASVSIGFNIVLENTENGYEGKGTVNAGEEIPLRITVRDEWNQDLDLSQVMNYWGDGDKTGNNKLYVKLEIEKQGFAPGYVLDMLGEQNYPEPLYEELLHPRTFKESNVKNLLYIPESSLKTQGYPRVKPMFAGTNNYEIKVSLADETGKTIFESPNPRRTAFLSVPTDMPADAFSIWFLSNPLGPHTEMSRFARMLLSTITFGDFGGFGSILSLADAASAINSGDAEGLVKIMVSELKSKTFGDIADKKGSTAEIFKTYNDMAAIEQYVSFGMTTYSDNGLVAKMEDKVISGIAQTALGVGKQLVVLKGDGNQKLIKDTTGEEPEAKEINLIKDKLKISLSGFDKKISEAMNKAGIKKKNKDIEIPTKENSFLYDESLNITSLKNGMVSVYVVPADMKIKSENAAQTISY